MFGRKMFYLGLFLLVTALAYGAWKVTARGAYESAAYSVVESEGPIEIREYPSLMTVTTSMQPESQGDDGSFMRLFQYISGSNDREQKVAMTTPVFMKDGYESEEHGQMAFVIPSLVAEQSVPEPSNDRVQIQQRSEGRFAVIQFSGRMGRKSVASQEDKLRKWIDQKGLMAVADIELAGYDPPWTPGPFRRNEILIRLK